MFQTAQVVASTDLTTSLTPDRSAESRHAPRTSAIAGVDGLLLAGTVGCGEVGLATVGTVTVSGRSREHFRSQTNRPRRCSEGTPDALSRQVFSLGQRQRHSHSGT